MYIMKKTLVLLATLAILALPSFGQTISGKSNSVTLQYFEIPASSPPAIVWINPDRGSITTDQTQFMVKIGINSHPRLKIRNVKVYKNNKALTSLGAGEPGSSLAAQSAS
jgi:hypothetical protein